MKLELLSTDDFADLNNLQQITNPVLFQRGGLPHPDGLLSEDIFGVTPKMRKETFGYIDLHAHFFSPHVYKVIKAVFRNIDLIISGEEYYSIKDGTLVRDPKGETGIEFIYENWDKIRWQRSDKPGIRNQRVSLLEESKKSDIFVRKYPVIPVAYRDISTSKGGGGTTDPLNTLYTRLIRLTDMTEAGDMFGFSFHQTNMTIQRTLLEIYDYFKSRLEKKTGMIRKYLMGKSIDYSTRTVITAPTFQADRPEDMIVSITHSGLPIHQICSLCYPFVIKWLRDFFEREVFDMKYSKFGVIGFDGTGEPKTKLLKFDKPEAIFNDKFFKKKIDSYIKDPGSRFDKIEIPVEGGKSVYLAFTGYMLSGEGKAAASSIANRPMTWTDVLFMACDEIIKDKHVMTTRYPVLDNYGIFFTKIRVLSTQQTCIMRVGDTVYKYYPIIDFNKSHDEITSSFIDSTQFSNAFLSGISGDYDGDQTTERILWSQEANKECDSQMKKKNFYLSSSGGLIRDCTHEATQTLYVLTKDFMPKARTLRDDDIRYFVGLKPEEYTFKLITDLFADSVETMGARTDRPTEIKKSKYNYHDIMELKGSMSPTGAPIKTTLGRYILYRALICYCGFEKVVPYFTAPINKDGYKKLESAIAAAYRDDKISTEMLQRYIDTRDWIGYQWHAVFCTSFSPEIIKIHPEVKKLKTELLEKYSKELAAGDPRTSEMIENALVDKSKELFKGNHGMDLYDSGARGSMGNNYKNTFLYRGAVNNPMTGQYDIIKTALSDGLEKTDIPATSNSILSGAYAKACGTANSGYLAKQLIAALQTERLDKKGTDCGSKNTIDFVLTDNHKVDYRYIVDNGKLVRLDPETKKDYIGKKIKLRSPMCCLGNRICNICAGDQFYLQEIENVGLLSVKLSGTLTNGNMKKFHSNLIKSSQIDPNTMLL